MGKDVATIVTAADIKNSIGLSCPLTNIGTLGNF
jgi:hypothetical protein